jgi:hypothetical protein
MKNESTKLPFGELFEASFDHGKSVWLGLEPLYQMLLREFRYFVPVFGIVIQESTGYPPTYNKYRRHAFFDQRVVFYPALTTTGENWRPANFSMGSDYDFMKFEEYLASLGAKLKESGRKRNYVFLQNDCLSPLQHGYRYKMSCKIFALHISEVEYLREEKGFSVVAERSGLTEPWGSASKRVVAPEDFMFKDADFEFNPNATEICPIAVHNNSLEYITSKGVRVYDNRSEKTALHAFVDCFNKKMIEEDREFKKSTLDKLMGLLGNAKDKNPYKRASEIIFCLEEITGSKMLPFADIFNSINEFRKRVSFKNLEVMGWHSYAPFPRVDYLNPYYVFAS